jgi:bacterioferritin-associated ferredoxin
MDQTGRGFAPRAALDYGRNINENSSHYKSQYESTAMYVCICNGITDRDIRQAAAAGANTLNDLRRELGVAAGCGRCASCAHAVLCESCGAGDASRPSLQPA